MTIELHIPDSIPTNPQDIGHFRMFLQSVVNRRCVGIIRYDRGHPDARKKYMSRLSRELTSYRSTGNVEQLFNIAVYAFLESCAPENKKLHWDTAADSVTREEFGGNIA